MCREGYDVLESYWYLAVLVSGNKEKEAWDRRQDFSEYIFCNLGPLAHPVEHCPFKAGVPRSSRGWVTIFLSHYLLALTGI